MSFIYPIKYLKKCPMLEKKLSQIEGQKPEKRVIAYDSFP